MSERASAAPLGEIPPARSRQQGRRSAVTLSDGLAVVGTHEGTLLGFEVGGAGPPTNRWRQAPAGEPSVVAATPFGGVHSGGGRRSASRAAGSVVVGERSARGAVRCHDLDGTLRWRYDTCRDVGDPQSDTRFLKPFVAGLATDGDRCYAAARRYERRPDQATERHFESVVYAFGADGTVEWTYHTDASPISLSVRGDRLAVAYNRCPGAHQHGLVVLDAADGTPRWMWDPGTDGQRRVGDVSLLEDGVVLTSHGDYHGYRLGPDGAQRWRLPLATPDTIGGDVVYAYPNHVRATASGAVFVTGNTYPEDGRETDVRHPEEHTAVGVSPDGDRRWSADVGGFASGLGADGDLLAVPGAQHFRDRNGDTHALRVFDTATGHLETLETAGVVTAAAVEGDTVVAVEEPVVYHDEGRERGAYRLHRADRSGTGDSTRRL